MKQKLIVILGQTSTGKSAFAVKLAKKINGEIISADSRQVYHELNLLSGKITKEEIYGIPHHLIDISSAKKVFSVAQFQKQAEKTIKEITKRNNVPILVGGTGLYIDAVTTGIALPEVPPNPKLRKELSKKSTTELFKQLKKLDPIRASNIDKNNPVRLIRAIEITKSLGRVPKIIKIESPYEMLKIGLTLSDIELKNKIHTRLLKRFKNGMLKEARTLHTSGISWKRMNELGLEPRFCAQYLQNQITESELMSQLEIAIWHYAKRQKTWFKRDKSTIWINPKDSKKALKLAKNFL